MYFPLVFPFLFYYFQQLADAEINNCLPTQIKSQCFVCSAYHYNIYSSSEDGTEPITYTDCQKKIINETYKNTIFINSNFNCSSSDMPCNGSLEHPFDDLFVALLDQSKKSREFMDSDIEFLLLGKEHTIREKIQMSTKTAIELFRRTFVLIKIRPLFCDELLLTDCLEKGDIVQINIKSSYVYFYVARALILTDITILGEGPTYIQLAPGKPNPMNFYTGRGLFNLERIVDEYNLGIWGNPSLEIKNCIIKFIYALGNLSSFISIENNWGSVVTCINSSIIGGYYADGFIRHNPSVLSSLYKNVDQEWIKEITISLAEMIILEFLLVNNSFTNYNEARFYDPSKSKVDQAFIKSRIDNFLDVGVADMQVLVNVTGNKIYDFAKEYSFLGTFIDLDGYVNTQSIFTVSSNIILNNNFELFSKFYRGLALIEFKGNHLENNKGNFFSVQNSNLIIQDLTLENNTIADYFIAMNKIKITIISCKYLRTYASSSSSAIILVLPNLLSFLENEFETDKASNSSENYIKILASLFKYGNVSLIQDTSISRYVVSIEFNNCLIENIFLEREFLHISIEYLLAIENTIFSNIDCFEIFVMPFARNTRLMNSTFENIFAAIVRINQIAKNSNRSLYCNITATRFESIYSHSSPYLFIIDTSYVRAYIDLNIISCELRNISLNNSADYSWPFDPENEKNWAFVFSNTQVIVIYNLIVSKLQFCSGFYVIHNIQAILDFYHSSVYMEEVQYDNEHAFALSFMKISGHRQILIKRMNCITRAEFMHSYFIDIFTSVGAVSFVESVFNVRGSKKQGAILNFKLTNVTALHIDRVTIANRDGLLNSSLLIITELSYIGYSKLKNYSNNNFTHSNTVYNENLTSIGYINMPKLFGIFNSDFQGKSVFDFGLIMIAPWSELVIVNCSFENLETTLSGGVLYLLEGASIYLENDKFDNCNSFISGGCLQLKKFSVLFSYNLSFKFSQAPIGAAIYLQQAFAEMDTTYFYEGTALNGGAISCLLSTLNIFNSFFENNKAIARGGSIFSEASTIYIIGCLFKNNTADEDGAAGYLYASEKIYCEDISIIKCRTNQRGAICIYGKKGSQMIMASLLCEENKASTGNCLYLEEGNIEIYNGLFKLQKEGKNILSFASLFSRAKLILSSCLIWEGSFHNDLVLLSSCEATFYNVTITHNFSPFYIFNFINSKIWLNQTVFNTVGTTESSIKCSAIMNLDNTQLEINYVKADGENVAGWVKATQSQILMAHADLKNFSSLRGAGFHLRVGCSLKVTFSGFSGNTAEMGSILYSEDSSIIFETVAINNNQNFRSGADIYSKSLVSSYESFIWMSNIEIENTYNTNMIIEGVESANLLNVSIKNGIYSKDSPKSIIAQNVALFRMVHCFFYRVSSIYYHSIGRGELNISRCLFSNFEVSSYGAVIYMTGLFNAGLYENVFLNSKAKKKGGAIFSDCDSDNCYLMIKDSQFENNTAGLSGGAIFINSLFAFFLIGNQYFFNTAVTGNDTAGYPNGFMVLEEYINDINEIKQKEYIYIKANRSKQSQISVSSGQISQFTVLVFDNFGNFQEVLSEGAVHIAVEGYVLEGNQASVTEGMALFKNFFFMGTPDTFIQSIIEFKSKRWTFTESMRIYIRNCIRGETFINNMCLPCAVGFYSISTPTSNKLSHNYCEVCPINADCIGRDIIMAKAGFFRLHSNTSLMVSCRITSACPAQLSIYEVLHNIQSQNKLYSPVKSDIPFYQQECSVGYLGNLCNSCGNSYSKISDGICVKCSEDTWYYLKYLLYILGSCGFIILQGILAMDFGEYESKKRSLFKIIINHTYFLTYVGRFSISWSREFIESLEISDKYLAPIPKEIVNFDCFLSPFMTKFNMHLSTYIIFIFQPIVLAILCFLLRLVTLELVFFIKTRLDFKGGRITLKEFHTKMNPEKKKKKFLLILQTLWVVCMYNLNSRTVLNTLELLKCIYLDDSLVTYLEKYPDFICWESEQHKRLLIFGFVPNFLVWCILWPGFLIYVLKNKKYKLIKPIVQKFATSRKANNELKSVKSSIVNILNLRRVDEDLKSTHKIFKFLTIDYVNKCFFWEMVFYFSNFLISFLLVATSRFSSISQGGCLITLFVLLLIVTEKKKPFRYAKMNKIQVASYMIMIITIALSMLTTDNNYINSTQKFMYLLIISLINFVYYLVWLLIYLRIFLQSIKGSNFVKNLVKVNVMKNLLFSLSPRKIGTVMTKTPVTIRDQPLMEDISGNTERNVDTLLMTQKPKFSSHSSRQLNFNNFTKKI